MTDDDTSPAAADGRWVLLFDPAWRGGSADEKPPVEAVVGGWWVEAGGTGPFEPNPRYAPSSPDSPTDPVDAVLRLVVDGDGDVAELFGALRHAELGVAVDDAGAAIVAPAPDDAPAVLVVTAPAHSHRVNVPGFRSTGARELADALPPAGVDVLLNPGAPASMRLLADAFQSAVAGPPAEPVDFRPEVR